MSAHPPVIKNEIGEELPNGVFRRTGDPAKYLIERRRFQRPTLSVVGGPEFEWPLGVEGLSISGSAAIAEHLFIGDNAAVLQVMHYDNRRIVMTGMFPGSTGSENMRDLLEVVTAQSRDNAKVLTLPSRIFPKTQVVVPETWTFDHPEEDGNDSWTYSLTMRRMGVGNTVKPPKTTVSPTNPVHSTAKAKGKTTRVFTTTSKIRTLRTVASHIYHNPNRWREIYVKNSKALDKIGTLAALNTKRLPIGMRLHY